MPAETFYITIVVPVFNTPDDVLTPCLEALRYQTLRSDEFEIILVDDASTDPHIPGSLQEFVEVVPNARVATHTRNIGLSGARQTGCELAEGSHVLFVDSDDILTRDAAETLRMKAHSSGADVVTCRYRRFSPTHLAMTDAEFMSQPLSPDPEERLCQVLAARRSYTMCGRLFRRQVLPLNAFDVPNQLHEDISSFVRVLGGVESVAHIDKVLYLYTDHGGSISKNATHEYTEDVFAALHDWIEQADHHDWPDAVRRAIAEGVDRLTATFVGRLLSGEQMSRLETAEALGHVRDLYLGFPRDPGVKREPRVAKFLNALDRNGPEIAIDPLKQVFGASAKHFGPSEFELRIAPTDVASRLEGRVVFVCQVDYHVRTAAWWCRELVDHGHRCAILDNSRIADRGLRRSAPLEASLRQQVEVIEVEQEEYGVDWLATADLVLLFNDFNDTVRDALEFRHSMGLPSASIVEGVNDFRRVDFEPFRFLPYRRCAAVLLPGEDDAAYFPDRWCRVVGMPGVERLLDKRPVFPERPLVAINVNFTYGALEEARPEFVESAVRACGVAKVDYAITQHPMDTADLSAYVVTRKTQYELIDDCTVFVSRFATGILEALASGKPAIYFNPHGERVSKYCDPLGAYDVATTAEGLAEAIKAAVGDVEAGVDFRRRAGAFLLRHAAIGLGETVRGRLSAAVSELLNETFTSTSPRAVTIGHGVGMNGGKPDRNGGEPDASISHGSGDSPNGRPEPAVAHSGGVLVGPYKRAAGARLEETDVVARLLLGSGGDRVLLDVGAHFGKVLAPFQDAGWRVVACEPDSNNRGKLLERFAGHPNVSIESCAVGAHAESGVPFFTSNESSGISSLRGFRDTHEATQTVDVTTVAALAERHRLTRIDFLKVDVEGFDLHVLRGVPWETIRPGVIVCEFEDAKTVPLGYTYKDMAEFLADRDYRVYLSEWHPIIRYGIAHEWKQLVRYPGPSPADGAWGNLVAFAEDPGPPAVAESFQKCLSLGNAPAKVLTSKRAPVSQRTGGPQYESAEPMPPTLQPLADGAGAAGDEMSRPPRSLVPPVQPAPDSGPRKGAERSRSSRARSPGLSMYDRVYAAVRSRNPALLEVSRLAMWLLRKVCAYPLEAGTYVLLLTGMVVLGLSSAGPLSTIGWFGAIALAIAGLMMVVIGFVRFLGKEVRHELLMGQVGLRHRLARMQSSLEDGARGMRTMEARVDELVANAAAATALEDQVAAVSDDLEDLGVRLTDWREEHLTERQQTANRLGALKADLWDANQRIDEGTALGAVADERIKRVREQAEVRAKATAEELGAKLEALEAAQRSSQEQLAGTTSASIAELRSELASLHEAHNEAIAAQAEARQATAEELGAKLEALEAAQRSSQEQLAGTTSASIAELRSELASLQSELADVADSDMSADIVSALRQLQPLWSASGAGSFELDGEREHGHAMLMAIMAADAKRDPAHLTGKTLIEVGTTRERHPNQGSTEKLAIFTALTEMRFVTVDMDPLNTERAKRLVTQLNPHGEAIAQRGETFLATCDESLDYVYLDAFDFYHENHSSARKARYRQMLNTEITDEASWHMHQLCAAALITRMPINGVVVIDDTWTDETGEFAGKGKLAVPLLLASGFEIIAQAKHSVGLRRISRQAERS